MYMRFVYIYIYTQRHDTFIESTYRITTGPSERLLIRFYAFVVCPARFSRSIESVINPAQNRSFIIITRGHTIGWILKFLRDFIRTYLCLRTRHHYTCYSASACSDDEKSQTDKLTSGLISDFCLH